MRKVPNSHSLYSDINMFSYKNVHYYSMSLNMLKPRHLCACFCQRLRNIIISSFEPVKIHYRVRIGEGPDLFSACASAQLRWSIEFQYSHTQSVAMGLS